ncbi:MAG: PfkB family carbohydrate kinase [Candidatus Thiodiazotropha sp.]
MRVLAVGGATLDIVNSVAAYPEEDDELRALSHHRSRGGNAANTLVVLSQLGHQCSWAGMLGDDAASMYILDDLRRNGVDTEWVTVHPGGAAPTSYVISSRASGSRTIVHYRDLPEYGYAAFEKIDLSGYDWVHIEGREVSVCAQILRHARAVAQSTMLSVELEKPRKDIERLIGLADFVMLSRSYASAHGYRNAQQLFDGVRPYSASAMLFAAWGEAGAWLQGADGRSCHAPAFHPPAVVDTLGAGDVFNAGLIDALLAGEEPELALNRAVHLAGEKCGRRGLCIA